MFFFLMNGLLMLLTFESSCRIIETANWVFIEKIKEKTFIQFKQFTETNKLIQTDLLQYINSCGVLGKESFKNLNMKMKVKSKLNKFLIEQCQLWIFLNQNPKEIFRNACKFSNNFHWANKLTIIYICSLMQACADAHANQ